MIASDDLRWKPVRVPTVQPIDPVDDGLNWARALRWVAVAYAVAGLVVWLLSV